MTIFTSSLIGACLSRWHGGGFAFIEKTLNIDFAKAFKNALYALPYGIVTGISYQAVYGIWWLSLLTGLFAWAIGFLKSTGHGRGFRLKEPMEEGAKPEKVEILIGWLMPHIPLYWYKVLIMTLTGVLPTLGASLAIGYLTPLYGLLIAIGGVFKGVNAMIFDKNTEYREFADGFTAYGCLALSIVLLLS